MQPTVKMTPIGKISTIATIIGTKEVQIQIKLTLEKFLKNFDEINTYPENTKYKHIYPKNHQGLSPKAIVLPEASPITTINLHSFGLIETLYIQNPEQQLKYFPQGLKTAVSRYFTRYAKNKEVFMQYYSNYPKFQITETGESGVSCPASKVIIMGISNEKYPTKNDPTNIEYTSEDRIRVDAELTIGMLRKIIYLSNNHRLNYKSDSMLLLTRATEETTIKEETSPFILKIWDNTLIKSPRYHYLMCELLRKMQFKVKLGEPHSCAICENRDGEPEDEVIEETEEVIEETERTNN